MMYSIPHQHPSTARTGFAALALATLALLTAGLFLNSAAAGDKQKKRVSLKQVYEQGRAAYYSDNFDLAKKKFELVLKYKPSHQLSKSYLSYISQREAARGGNPAMQKQMHALVLEEVDLDEITIAEAVEYLTLNAIKQSKGTFKPNIVLKNLSPGHKSRTFQLKLHNVPLDFALKTAGELAGIRFDFEKYAVVGTPKSASSGKGDTAASASTDPQ